MFACLNVMRIHLMKALKISELELSQNYLFYYDKVSVGRALSVRSNRLATRRSSDAITS